MKTKPALWPQWRQQGHVLIRQVSGGELGAWQVWGQAQEKE